MALNHNILLETGTNEFEIVEFLINADKAYHFCINVAKVREVIRFPEIVHVPDAHDAIVGTANIRQHLVPIIDLGYWLGLRPKKHIETTEITKVKKPVVEEGEAEETERLPEDRVVVKPEIDNKVIVTFFNHIHSGFMVDEVIRIHRITWADIKDYSSITDFHMIDSVLGVVNIQGKMIQLLDFESIIAELNPNSKLMNTEIDMSLKDERAGLSVFLAEDSPVIRRLLIQNFTKAGYVVEAFDNGAKLLKRLESTVPDLIITDLEMPVTGGDFVVRTVRESIPKSALPIIVFSSMASEENEKKLLGVGANRFIGKPELTLLVSLVDDYLIRGKK